MCWNPLVQEQGPHGGRALYSGCFLPFFFMTNRLKKTPKNLKIPRALKGRLKAAEARSTPTPSIHDDCLSKGALNTSVMTADGRPPLRPRLPPGKGHVMGQLHQVWCSTEESHVLNDARCDKGGASIPSPPTSPVFGSSDVITRSLNESLGAAFEKKVIFL